MSWKLHYEQQAYAWRARAAQLEKHRPIKAAECMKIAEIYEKLSREAKL